MLLKRILNMNLFKIELMVIIVIKKKNGIDEKELISQFFECN